MPRRPRDEDLFAGSTMTFGEHLEELRACLIKALIALVIGFLVGMLIGKDVVRLIQFPLESALKAHYEKWENQKAAERLQAIADEKGTLPADAKTLELLVSREHLLPQEVYLDPGAVFEQLKAKYPETFRDVKLPTSKGGEVGLAASSEKPTEADLNATAKTARENLIRVYLFHSVEDDARVRATGFNPQEAFSIWMKASLLVGVIVASPVVFYQIWLFVAAGLYPHEKQYIHVYLPMSLGLFLAGASLAFFFVFEPVLSFLFGFNAWLGIDIDPRISEWLGFVLILPLGFGVSFQLPLVMLFLERIGVVTIDTYKSKLRISILVIFVLAAILTPADPWSMLLMAVPLTGLFFVGILLCKLMPRRRSPLAEA